MSNPIDKHLADVYTEESVISRLIGTPDAYYEVSHLLCEESFSDQYCRDIWKAIVWAVRENKTPDLPFLRSTFADGNKALLNAVDRIAKTQVSSDIAQQVEILEERRKRRIYHQLRIDLMSHEDEDSHYLDAIVSDAMEKRDKFTASTILDKWSLMQHAVNVISDNQHPERVRHGVPTPFRILPELPPESEVIIAAFSSQGKTSFAMTMVDHAMRIGYNCALYSAEMGKSSIVGRFLNMMGWNVPISVFKTQQLLDASIEDFNAKAAEFVNRPGNIFVDDSSNNNVDYICSSIRVLHRKHGLQLVMVDYLQIIALYDESGASDQEKLARASRKLQAIAKELNICILVLSQFSRPSRDQGHQPTEDLIRGSGQIYEACDIALYIYRPEKWESETYPAPFQDAEKRGTAMIKIGKYRDGESGKSEIVGFDGPRTLFFEFQEGAYSPDPFKNYPKTSSVPSPMTPINDRPF